MSEAFIISSFQTVIEPGQPRSEAAAAVLQGLLLEAGLPARRIQEIHWQVPPRGSAPAGTERAQEYDVDPLGPWLIQLAQRLGFSPGLSAFLWPAAPLLDHYILQSNARAMQLNARDVVILGQFAAPGGGPHQPGHAAVVLLASPAAVGRHNLAPQARLAALLAFNAAQSGILGSACAALKRLNPGVELSEQPEAQEEPASNLYPEPEDVAWLAGAVPLAENEKAVSFPNAQILVTKPPAPSGDLFLLAELVKTMAGSKTDWGLLIGHGPQETGLITLLERI
jgi:hypothetical protein